MTTTTHGNTIVSEVRPGSSRVLSVDVLRGLTVALMILVNDAGDFHHTYQQLEHASWNGLTLTDLVFPTFLYIVGVSLIFSLEARIRRGASRGELARNIFRRALTIFLINMVLAAIPRFHFTELRVFGVLTRIAICYFVVGMLCLVTRRVKILLAISAFLLVLYWVLMRFVPVPGWGVPTHAIPILDPDRNLAATIDRGINGWMQQYLHTGRLYERTRDPEGLLSTIPALVTTILGCVTALWLRRTRPADRGGEELNVTEVKQEVEEQQSPTRTLVGLLAGSAFCLVTGILWNFVFPINKKLWTSSYVLVAAGISLLGLALCYWIADVRQFQRRSHAARLLLFPWIVFGSSAITAYAVSELIAKLMTAIRFQDLSVSGPASNTTAWAWTYRHLFAFGGSTNNTSVTFAIVFVIVCFIPNYLLWRKGIILKV